MAQKITRIKCDDLLDSENFVFSGSSFQVGHGAKMIVGKMSSTGQLLWLKRYEDMGGWFAFDLVQDTSDGGVVVAGGKPFDGTTPDAVIFKTDSLGNRLWSHQFGGPWGEHFESIIRSCDGGYVAAGTICPTDPNIYEVFLAKVSANGDSLWTRILNPGLRSWAHRLIATPDCGFIIAGECETADASHQMLLIKADSLGNEIWTRLYGGSNAERCFDVRPLAEGGYILSGQTRSYGQGNMDTYLVRVDEEGDTVWTAAYGTPYQEYACSALEVPDGDLVVAGMGNEHSFGSGTDLFVTRLGTANGIGSSHPGRESDLAPYCTCFPNPCNGWPSIQLSPDWFERGKMKVEVYNLLGQCLIRREWRGQGQSKQLISLSENRTLKAASGVYLLRVTATEKTRLVKFCVLK